MGLNLSGRRVLILRTAPEGKTAAGIYLPDQSIEQRYIGTVVLIGDLVDKRFEGKQVLFEKHGGEPLLYEGVQHTVLFEPEIIGILN